MFYKNPRLPRGILRSRPEGIPLGSPDSFKEKYLRVLCVSSAAGGKSIRPFQGCCHATLIRGEVVVDLCFESRNWC